MPNTIFCIVQSAHIPLAGSVGVTTAPKEQLSRGSGQICSPEGGVSDKKRRESSLSLRTVAKESFDITL